MLLKTLDGLLSGILSPANYMSVVVTWAYREGKRLLYIVLFERKHFACKERV
jgi:hypothetical protein